MVALPSHPSGPLLVMSSAFSSVARINMTIHVSADNGYTWNAVKQVYPLGSAYSALIPLGPSQPSSVGLLFEKDDYQTIVYSALDINV